MRIICKLDNSSFPTIWRIISFSQEDLQEYKICFLAESSCRGPKIWSFLTGHNMYSKIEKKCRLYICLFGIITFLIFNRTEQYNGFFPIPQF